MNSRAFAVLVTLALLLAGGFTFLLTRPPATQAEGSLAPSEEVVVSPSTPSQVETLPGTSTDVVETRAGEPGPRALVPGTESVPPQPGTQVEIEVVLAGTRVGLDKARVRYAEVDTAWLGKNLPSLVTTRSWLGGGRLGSFVQAEPLGRGRFGIATPKAATVVIADFDVDVDTRLRGYAFLGSTLEGPVEHPKRIELGAPGELVVRVVGFDGGPLVGHRVDVQAEFPWGPATIPFAKTDECGELRLLNLDSMLGTLLGSGLVTVSTLGSDGVATTQVFAANEVPEGPLLLTIDAGCRAELRAVDGEGRPIVDRDITFEFFELPLDGSAHRTVRARNGVAIVDGLRPGVEVGAFERKAIFGATAADLDRAATGKTVSGGLLRLDVLIERKARRVFTGRLVDEEGVGFGEATFRLVITMSDGSQFSGVRGKTDADGQFQLEYEEPAGWHAPLAGDVTTFQANLEGLGPIRMFEPVTVPGVLSATLELGDLRGASESLIVAGRVVDAAGNPLVGADVKAGRFFETKGLDPRSAHWATILLMPLPGIQNVKTDTSGHFEIHGPAPTSDFQVRASATGFVESPGVICEPGARDLGFVLQGAGRMGGYLILGDTQAAAWDVGIWPEDTGAEETFVPKPLSQSWHTNDKWAYSAPFAKSGIFAWIDMPAGRYSVRVIARAGGEEIALVRGVLVEAGEDCRDPRLQGIDVSQLLSEVIVRVRDETGQIPGGATVGLANPEAQHVAYTAVASGEKKFLLAKVPREVFVSAPGFAMQKVEVTSGTFDVVLRRGVPLVVQLPAGLEWGTGGLPVAYLSPTDWHLTLAANGLRSFDDEGRATWILPAAGEYSLFLTTAAWGKTKGSNGFTQLVSVPVGGIGEDATPVEASITQADIPSF